jgi:hypothetical protein
MGSIRMYAMVKDMLKHVYNMNEMSLTDMLEIAFEMYPVRVVCSDIIAPMMAEIGNMWERGEMMVVMEHFASSISFFPIFFFSLLPLHFSCSTLLQKGEGKSLFTIIVYHIQLFIRLLPLR